MERKRKFFEDANYLDFEESSSKFTKNLQSKPILILNIKENICENSYSSEPLLTNNTSDNNILNTISSKIVLSTDVENTLNSYSSNSNIIVSTRIKHPFNENENENENDNENEDNNYEWIPSKKNKIKDNYNKPFNLPNLPEEFHLGNDLSKKNNSLKKKNNYDDFIHVNETWDEYKAIVKLMDKKKNIDWIYEIMKGEREQINVVYIGDSFICITNGTPFDNLVSDKFKLLFFPYDMTIRSIRDLNNTHISLLNNMKEKAYEIVKYYFSFSMDDINNNVNKNSNNNKLKMEFHYTPSTYLLHLHVSINDTWNHNKSIHICHSLDSVIKNITESENGDYYKLNDIKIKVRRNNISERIKNINDNLCLELGVMTQLENNFTFLQFKNFIENNIVFNQISMRDLFEIKTNKIGEREIWRKKTLC